MPQLTQALLDRAEAPRLEKVPAAASRAGLSTSQFYRLAKAGHFRIVKIGERASAVSAAEVDAFIRDRLASFPLPEVQP